MAQPTAGGPARPEAETKAAEEGDARVESAGAFAEMSDGQAERADVGVEKSDGQAAGADVGVEKSDGQAERADVGVEMSDVRAERADVAAEMSDVRAERADVVEVPEGTIPWGDPEVFGEMRPSTLPSQVPDTFRPLTRGEASPERANDDDASLDVSRFLKRSNPWARTGIGVGVALALGLMGFAISRGPGHSAAEEIVLASSGPHHEPSEVLLAASLAIGKACGDGRATSPATVRVIFRPEGDVQSAVVTGAHAGTPVGDCVAAKVRELRSKPFQGPSSTVTEQISLSR